MPAPPPVSTAGDEDAALDLAHLHHAIARILVGMQLGALGLAAGCLTSTGHTAALFGFTDLAGLSALGKSVCIGLMLLGRVEIFSALLFACFVGERLRRRW